MPSLPEALRSQHSVVAAELRPPRAELDAARGMDAWIDTYHAVRSLTRHKTYVLLTDSAVGLREEDNLRHLVANIGEDVPRELVVPFLTCKHPKQYCLSYAEQAGQYGFPALVVLGGDRHVGPPRCVNHAWELREQIRVREPGLLLGGWANPYRDPAGQVAHLMNRNVNAEFYLTQIVTHHDPEPVERFLAEVDRRGLALPGVFGVFYYRSAKPGTLAALRNFIPVPAESIAKEFAAGVSPEEICARTLRAMAALGVRHFYVSNLPLSRAGTVLASIVERAQLRTRLLEAPMTDPKG
jgi:5,10-methylenetetrahydrofolate reductase